MNRAEFEILQHRLPRVVSNMNERNREALQQVHKLTVEVASDDNAVEVSVNGACEVISLRLQIDNLRECSEDYLSDQVIETYNTARAAAMEERQTFIWQHITGQSQESRFQNE